MPASSASESGGSGRRNADLSAQHRKDALIKFPDGYCHNAKYHHATLKAINKNKPCKPGTFDHFLLFTFFPELKPAPSKSPSNNADKSSGGKAASKKKPEKGAGGAAPSSSDSSSSDNDDSVRRVQKSKPDQELQKRAAADDAPPAPAPGPTLSEIITDPVQRPVVNMDADTVLGQDHPSYDTPENNVKVAEEAAARREVKNRRSSALPKASKHPGRRPSASDDEMRLGTTARKRRRADDSDSSSGEKGSAAAAKKPRKRKSVTVDTETEEDDEDVRERKSRFTKRAESNLLVEYAHEIDKLRPLIQRTLLQRDGAELREGSTHRTLNLHTILKVASSRMNGALFRQFRKACNESYEDPHDA